MKISENHLFLVLAVKSFNTFFWLYRASQKKTQKKRLPERSKKEVYNSHHQTTKDVRVGPGAARRGGEGVRPEKENKIRRLRRRAFVVVARCLLACCDYGARQQTGGGARLLRLWNGWDALPVYRALSLFFNCLFFVSSLLLSEIGDRVQGQGFVFAFNFEKLRILAIVFSAKTRAKLITPTYN